MWQLWYERNRLVKLERSTFELSSANWRYIMWGTGVLCLISAVDCKPFIWIHDLYFIDHFHLWWAISYQLKLFICQIFYQQHEPGPGSSDLHSFSCYIWWKLLKIKIWQNFISIRPLKLNAEFHIFFSS